VPTGKVKWYDTEKGFGFVSKDEGGDVFVHSSALPAGVTSLRQGQRIEFGVADGKRGEQALSVRVLEPTPSLSRALRKPPDEMAIIVEDLIKLLDRIGEGYRRGRHPDPKSAGRVAQVLRGVADDLEV
jgi:CspA family cold shock protein